MTDSEIVVKQAQNVCPFCKSSVDDAEPQRVCSRCLTRHHDECWSQNGATCAVFGCRSESYLVPTEQQAGQQPVLPGAVNVAPTLFRHDPPKATQLEPPAELSPEALRRPAALVVGAAALVGLMVALAIALFII